MVAPVPSQKKAQEVLLVLILSLHHVHARVIPSSIPESGVTRHTTATTVRYSNILPRRDVHGDIIDAHDGNYVWSADDQKWYYFAMGYGKGMDQLCTDNLPLMPFTPPHIQSHTHTSDSSNCIGIRTL